MKHARSLELRLHSYDDASARAAASVSAKQIMSACGDRERLAQATARITGARYRTHSDHASGETNASPHWILDPMQAAAAENCDEPST
jgi:transcription antitermination factor NusA-like protein